MTDPKDATGRGLLGLVADGKRFSRPETVERRILADQKVSNALAQYEERRAKARNTADTQWKLAVWCEQNGLEAEAKAHFGEVTRLDPKRELAWKKLGYRKYAGRWATEEEIVAEKREAEARARQTAAGRGCLRRSSKISRRKRTVRTRRRL